MVKLCCCYSGSISQRPGNSQISVSTSLIMITKNICEYGEKKTEKRGKMMGVWRMERELTLPWLVSLDMTPLF